MPDAPSEPLGRESATPPGAASASFLLMTLGRLLREEVEVALRGEGLSMRHLSALGHLSKTPGLSYSELARRAGVTAQSMQATLTHLEEMGAVERRTPTGRGRTAQLHLTGRGTELLGRGRRTIAAADERLLGSVPADQRAQLAALLLQAFSAVSSTRADSGRSERQAQPGVVG